MHLNRHHKHWMRTQASDVIEQAPCILNAQSIYRTWISQSSSILPSVGLTMHFHSVRRYPRHTESKTLFPGSGVFSSFKRPERTFWRTSSMKKAKKNWGYKASLSSFDGDNKLGKSVLWTLTRRNLWRYNCLRADKRFSNALFLNSLSHCLRTRRLLAFER